MWSCVIRIFTPAFDKNTLIFARHARLGWLVLASTCLAYTAPAPVSQAEPQHSHDLEGSKDMGLCANCKVLCLLWGALGGLAAVIDFLHQIWVGWADEFVGLSENV